MSVLWSVRADMFNGVPKPFAAIAYYPGCVQVARIPGWAPTVPLTILSGALDDWTQPAPCRELAARTGARYIEYPGAYHGFDAPNSAVRVRTGLGRVKGGEAHTGTNPEARAASIAEVMAILGAK